MTAIPEAVHEVEVKYRVGDEAALVAALAAHGVVLSDAVSQDDQAYAPAAWRYGMSKIGVPFARLRTQDGRHLFTVKRPVDNEMACLEYETVVADREQMHAALVTMGFTPTVRIVKRRRTGRWGEVSLCLDAVEGLGAFVEAEALIGSDDSGWAVQERLDGLVRSLGVPVMRTTDTYDSLLRSAAAAG
ncbi:CYTH domain-containing protein [Verrucosispora sp. WMMA2121]|uniref:class IV adenylate cyclase n=1 Tax=Verrucosispora sp. WMMA2121 TaxID=3015164 RepID=UPI0022B62D28|nr:CYTH domain-containing protein [Verrucosispora sp. WMMA2121]MCZ7421911.1 CYTH domain-containing protein [Verrucosispora sp. WMMA2121]